jgi:hypothetical protein
MDKMETLIKLGRELGIPIPIAYVRYRVTDKKGRILSDQYGPGHSWTRNYYNFMFASGSDGHGDGGTTFGAGYMSSKQTTTAIHAVSTLSISRNSPTQLGWGVGNNTTSNDYGIVVGTNDTAFGFDQHALGALIASGNAAGQLAYQAQLNSVQAYTAGTKTWKTTHKRLFNNNSGALITVKESALYWKGLIFYDQVAAYMLERNVPATPIDVAIGAQLTVTYEISMVFPD